MKRRNRLLFITRLIQLPSLARLGNLANNSKYVSPMEKLCTSYISAVFDQLLRSAIRTRVWIMVVTAVLICNGCTALQEAQQRRDKRILEERNANSLMLAPSEASERIKIGPDALESTSDHYELTFAKDLYGHPELDTVEERETFARSALGYMESLYDAMHRLFGFPT